jgi:hypothetical protein
VPRVVLVCLDGLPVRHVGPELTPNLIRLSKSGGMAPTGGLALMPSSTYVNHASMLTGAGVDEHGILPGGEPPKPPWERQVRVPTLFEYLSQQGVEARAVVGDQHLVHVLRLEHAASVWPPTNTVPPGVTVDSHGWIVDTETLPRLLGVLETGARFVFGHFNDPDTAGHDFGPDSAEAAEVYHNADAALGQVMGALADEWDDTVLIAVSDHDMLPRDERPPVAIVDDSITIAVPEGGAAWLWPAEGANLDEVSAAALRTPGVSAVVDVGGLPLAILEPGRIAYWETLPERGFHGGTDARSTVAVVGGGHPAARTLGQDIERTPPLIQDWTPRILNLLSVDGVYLRRTSNVTQGEVGFDPIDSQQGCNSRRRKPRPNRREQRVRCRQRFWRDIPERCLLQVVRRLRTLQLHRQGLRRWHHRLHQRSRRFRRV